MMIITKGCPTGWKKFHLTGKCYKKIMDGLMTFWDASSNCQKLAQSFGSTIVQSIGSTRYREKKSILTGNFDMKYSNES